MKFLKNNFKLILACIITAILVGGIVYAATSASQVTYTTSKNGNVGTVADALNDLYDKVNKKNNNSDNILYLYWKGQTYNDITGGWVSTVTGNLNWYGSGSCNTKKDGVLRDDYIELYTDSTYQSTIINTANKIPCQNYNYITVYYYYTQNYNARLRIDESLEWSWINHPSPTTRALTEIKNYNGLVSFTMPISCTNPAYIGFEVPRGASQDPLTDLKVYGVYLSKTLIP